MVYVIVVVAVFFMVYVFLAFRKLHRDQMSDASYTRLTFVERARREVWARDGLSLFQQVILEYGWFFILLLLGGILAFGVISENLAS